MENISYHKWAISLHASIVQWNSQETMESDFLSSKHGRGSS